MPKGQPSKRYTPEFKIKVVETMHREKLSYRETARQFDIPNSRVTAWERIYLEEGAEGLCIERRGRKSTGRPPKIKKDEALAEAISALPVDRRDIILLSYFLDMSDAEIANVLNMVRRSVAYRRTSTLKLLKNPMGGENR